LRLLAAYARAGVVVVFYDAVGALPHFNPDLDREGDTPPPEVAALRAQLIAADAIVISSPEYAHGVPGSLKNLLDWLVSVGELVEKPVMLLNAAPAGGEYAQSSLAETLATMNWHVLRVPPFVKCKGVFDDADVTAALRDALRVLADASR
jgi:NAD(P)H-dependent FMN reductase